MTLGFLFIMLLSSQLTRVLSFKSAFYKRSCSTLLRSTERIDTTTQTSATKKKRVLSGVQPTGTLHLGNYLGAIRQWVSYQELYDNYFCVVDLHAITAPHNPKELSINSRQSAAMYMACGIDPKKSKIFIQSHVTAHAELTWLLNCITPIGWLERMIQYKEKSIKHGDNVSIGLIDYPVLMASDILLYQTDLVPVGEDQRQHLELTRDIARRFNHLYCKKTSKIFREPIALINNDSARIMSLQDGTNKMSKSADNDYSRINLLDSYDLIKLKIKKCKTDSYNGIEYNNPNRPEATNLINIYKSLTGDSIDKIQNDIENLTWGKFKPLLTDVIIEHLKPIQSKYNDIISDPILLDNILKDGQESANIIAQETLKKAKNSMGLLPNIH